MTNLLPTRPVKFRIPIEVLAQALPDIAGFPIECTEKSCPEFDKPALFIRGTRSHYIQPKHYPTMRKMFPRMKILEVDSAHWVHVEAPDEVQDEMYDPVTPSLFLEDYD
jgi:pimeloyl-ACP methyl ester carboxylesterase